ncbi:MAG: GAF domain-containing protein [Proteobacteria bacterium]|nr:GAF domain-containing protein [Pseudomonadota bacterium]
MNDRITPGLVLWHAADRPVPPIPDAPWLAHQPCETPADWPIHADATGVLWLDAPLHAGEEGALAALPQGVVVVASDPGAAEVAEAAGRLFLDAPAGTSETGFARVLRAALQLAASRRSELLAAERAREAAVDLHELSQVGAALMRERDLDRLLARILREARRITQSDAGSLYLAEESREQTRLLFRLTQNDSLDVPAAPDFSLPLDTTSLAGYAATTLETLRIDDVYAIPDEAPYRFNADFDARYGYRARSMLVTPMCGPKGRLVGVLQLMNAKRASEARVRGEADANEWVRSYTPHDAAVVESLAGQAAVSIENGRLHQSIERLFEGFITAAVGAIEERDPSTSGHSLRVASLTCALAEAADRSHDRPHRAIQFSREQFREIRYAALLHDFGKVGVREDVLGKARKLPPLLDERIRGRFRWVRAALQARFHEQRAEYLLANGPSGFELFEKRLRAEQAAELERLEAFERAVRLANEPRVLPEDQAERLAEVAEARYRVEGREVPLLEPDELHFVRIERGSLDPAERAQIESHVAITHRFLEQIPWTHDLSQVAEIAYGHHEKLDGSGYPRGLRGEAIPVQTRIMTIADIFDALTAGDRPYKSSLTPERALDILHMEARDGKVDADLLALFVASGVYHRVLSERP